MLSDALIARALFSGGGGSGGASQPKVINLCDHGINAWELLGKGAGLHKIDVEGNSLFNELPSVGKDFVLTNIDGVNNPVTINNVVVAYKDSSGSSPMQVCFSVAIYNYSVLKADFMIFTTGNKTQVVAEVKFAPAS